MPESCATYTPIMRKVYKDPVYGQNVVCDAELVTNGDAESNGFNPAPIVAGGRLVILEEDGNKFFRLSGRSSYASTIKYDFDDTTCFTRGVTYIMSARVRYQYTEGFVGGSVPYYWLIQLKRGSDGVVINRNILNCNAQTVRDGWVRCSGEFMIDTDIADAPEASLLMAIEDVRDGGRYVLDYDDISVRYHKGYVDELVVDSEDVSCWGNNADVHVTSATYYSELDEKGNGFVSQIQGVVDPLQACL